MTLSRTAPWQKPWQAAEEVTETDDRSAAHIDFRRILDVYGGVFEKSERLGFPEADEFRQGRVVRGARRDAGDPVPRRTRERCACPLDGVGSAHGRHRSEHWVVVRGTARVTRDATTLTLSENQSTYIPPGARHRLGNPGADPLEVIEVQVGAYLGEDDIARFDDDFGRSGTGPG